MKTKSSVRKKTDEQTHRIYDVLMQTFPSLSKKESDVVYKKDDYNLRVCVIDKRFSKMSLSERLDMFDRAADALDSEDHADISMVLVLAPEDLDDPTDLMMKEFFEPSW